MYRKKPAAFIAGTPKEFFGNTIITRKNAQRLGRFIYKCGLDRIKKNDTLNSKFVKCQAAIDKLQPLVKDIYVPGIGRYGQMDKGSGNFSSDSNSFFPFIINDTFNYTSFLNTGERSRIYRTNLIFGRPTTRSIFSRKTINNNLSTRCFFDTERDYIEGANRKYLTSEFGFNQRRFDFLSLPTHTTLKDFKNLLKSHKLDHNSFEDKLGKVNMYGDILNEKCKLTVRSECDHYVVRVKIHLIAVKDLSLSFKDLFESTFSRESSQLNMPGTAYERDDCCYTIPPKRQISTFLHGGSFKDSVITDTECVLSMSDYFSHNAKIIETYSKALQPGDIWNFNYTFYYGPGVLLNKLYNLPVKDINGEHPYNYCIAIQLDGDPRGSVTRLVDNQVFNGNAPGRVSYNFSRTMDYLFDTEKNDGGDTMSYRKFTRKSDNFSSADLSQQYYSSLERSARVNVDFDQISWSKFEIIKGNSFKLNYGQHSDLPISLMNDTYFQKIGRTFYNSGGFGSDESTVSEKHRSDNSNVKSNMTNYTENEFDDDDIIDFDDEI